MQSDEERLDPKLQVKYSVCLQAKTGLENAPDCCCQAELCTCCCDTAHTHTIQCDHATPTQATCKAAQCFPECIQTWCIVDAMQWTGMEPVGMPHESRGDHLGRRTTCLVSLTEQRYCQHERDSQRHMHKKGASTGCRLDCITRHARYCILCNRAQY